MSKIILIIFIIITFFPPPIEKIRYNIRIILSLCVIIFILQNIEGFGTGIDGEALRNIASLYNSADGTLKVKNLEASGNIETTGGKITETGDIKSTDGNVTATGYGEFGNAYIGPHLTKKDSTWADFCHKSLLPFSSC